MLYVYFFVLIFIKIYLIKVFEILSSNKYYGQFKTTQQYLKVLSEIEFNDLLTDHSGKFVFLLFLY